MPLPIKRGEFAGVPFASVGAGPPLVVLPGLSQSVGVDGDGFVRGALAPVRRLANRRRLVVLNRWPDLPPDLTMSLLAGRHAEAIRAGFEGEPVDLLGMSTGGSIAQQLAVEYPELVRRLVLVSTACRLGPVGRREQARVARLLGAGAIRAACREVGADLMPWPLRPLGAAAGWLTASWLIGSARAAADLQATLEAEDSFDLAGCAGSVRAPTLIVAGGRDRFYGRELFEETRELVPDSRLVLRPRRGHVTVTFDRAAVAAIAGFLQA